MAQPQTAPLRTLTTAEHATLAGIARAGSERADRVARAKALGGRAQLHANRNHTITIATELPSLTSHHRRRHRAPTIPPLICAAMTRIDLRLFGALILLAVVGATSVPRAQGVLGQAVGDNLRVDDGVSDANRDDVTDGLRIGRTFIAATFGAMLAPGIDVLVRDADDGPPEAHPDRWIRINVRNRGWSARAGASGQGLATLHRQTMAHELFHIFQYDLNHEIFAQRARERESTLGGPGWLIEGSAEVVGYRALAHAGVLDYGRAIACNIQQVLGSPQTPPLQMMESKRGFNDSLGNPYGLAFLGVELLIAERGIGSLQTYYESITAADWADAFVSAFGTDIGAFYARFDAYRQSLQQDRTVNACDWQR